MNWSTEERRLAHENAIVLHDDTAGSGPTLEVRHKRGKAVISRQGAQLLSFMPTDGREMIWLSPATVIGSGKSIRGGTPVCWPWFADHPTDPSKPSHGFARNRDWTLVASDTGDEAHRIALALEVENDPHWPHRARVALAVTVSSSIELALTTLNTGSEAFPLTSALHTYFAVSDIDSVTITGLEGLGYIDKLRENTYAPATGQPIDFNGELDRIYLGSPREILIHDREDPGAIGITAQGSRSTVVWNPAVAKAERLGDLGPLGWRRFVCVETANAGDDVVMLEPGQSHRLCARYKLG